MSKIVDDVKSGLKGIRGAGDALRGGLMEATDDAFDNNNKHPITQANQAKNRAIAEKGKQDIRGADEMVARHEWQRKGVAPPGETTTSSAGAGGGLEATSGTHAHSGYHEAPSQYQGAGATDAGYGQGNFSQTREGYEGVPTGPRETGTHAAAPGTQGTMREGY
jgi:hypothetical protein